MKLLRLYQSDKGIWRYDIERQGGVYYVSLRTRSEAKAKAAYEKLRLMLADYEKDAKEAQRGRTP